MPTLSGRAHRSSSIGDKADLATNLIFRSPVLVVEVLSRSTQAYERSQKFALYRCIPSLQEYILVKPDTRGA